MLVPKKTHILPAIVLSPPQERVDWSRAQDTFRNILAYTGFSLNDVVNNPVAKNAVLGYFKLKRDIVRQGEILELETQWNRF